MAVNELNQSPAPASLEQLGEFWDTHDFTDFDDPQAPDVEFQITCAVPIEAELLATLEQHAQRRGVQAETLVNLWLQEKLLEQKWATELADAA